MSNISKQHDGDLDIQTNEIRNVSMLIAPTISCWEAGRWELTRARLQRSSDASLESTSSIRGHFEPKQRKPRKFRGRSNESFELLRSRRTIMMSATTALYPSARNEVSTYAKSISKVVMTTPRF